MVLEDCFQKRFSSEGDHGSFSLAPNSPAELIHCIKLEIQGRGSRKARGGISLATANGPPTMGPNDYYVCVNPWCPCMSCDIASD